MSGTIQDRAYAMSDDTRKPTKERSPNFPFVSLETAIRRAQEFYAVEKRGIAPVKVAAKHWNYSPNSSGALQTMAALKSYGLMNDEGSGDQRKVRLTDLALRILLDARPNSTERLEYMRRAALAPQVAGDIYAQWPHDLPSEANLRHYLVFDRKFNEEAARKVVKIIFENEILTSSSASVLQSSESETEEDMEAPSYSDVRPLASPADSARRVQAASNVERIKAPGADIQMIFSDEPTYETYDFLEKYVALRKAVLKKNDPQ